MQTFANQSLCTGKKALHILFKVLKVPTQSTRLAQPILERIIPTLIETDIQLEQMCFTPANTETLDDLY